MIVARDRCAVGLIDPPEVLCVTIQSTQSLVLGQEAPEGAWKTMCRATYANGKSCNNRVHADAGRCGHCEWTCGLHKNRRPEQLRGPDEMQSATLEQLATASSWQHSSAAPSKVLLPATTQEIVKVPVTKRGGPPAKAERHRLRASLAFPERRALPERRGVT